MIIIWGSRLCGKTDEVPGFFHVSTSFGHLWYIPLLPLGSHLVLQDTGDQTLGVEIGLRFKSVILGWLRTACVIIGVTSLFAALAVAGGGEALQPLLLGGMSFVAFFALRSSVFRLASYERAQELAELAGLNAVGKVMLELHFGRIEESEVQSLIEEAARIEAEAQRVEADAARLNEAKERKRVRGILERMRERREEVDAD